MNGYVLGVAYVEDRSRVHTFRVAANMLVVGGTRKRVEQVHALHAFFVVLLSLGEGLT